MNLAEIRHLFRSISGRYDLTEADAGQLADFYINEGSKWLDRLDETRDSWATSLEIIHLGDWFIQFPSCRSIKEVWASTTSSGRWQLEKKRLQDILLGRIGAHPTSIVPGTPLYYSPTYARYIPETVTQDDLDTLISFILMPDKATYGHNTILLSVPVSENVLIEIKGLFYSAPLITEEDENQWSAQFPLLLALAAVRQVHMSSGNISMLKNVDEPLKAELTSLGFDLVEQIIAEVDQMEG